MPTNLMEPVKKSFMDFTVYQYIMYILSIWLKPPLLLIAARLPDEGKEKGVVVLIRLM